MSSAADVNLNRASQVTRVINAKHMRKPLNICMLAYAFYETDTRIMQYATALVEQGENVDVIALQRDRDLLKYEIMKGVHVYRIQHRALDEKNIFSYISRLVCFFIRSLMFFLKKSTERHYDVVHVHNVPDCLVFTALIPKLRNAKVILDIHDLLPELYASKFVIDHSSLLFRVLLFIEQQSVKFADHIVVANHIWRDRLVTRSSEIEKFSVIRNHPDLSIFISHVGPRLQKSKFTITYPGSLNWHQGLDIAIRAFALVFSKMSDAEFHIYGEGPARQSLQKLVSQLGLTEHIIFHNFLPSSDIARIMAVTDLAIEPKRSGSAFSNEALSTKILEFLSLGVPVIACRTKIHAYYYDDSLVQYYENDDEIKLAEQIIFLRNNPTRCDYLIQNGRRYANENTWDVKKQEYLELIASLCDQEIVMESLLLPEHLSHHGWEGNGTQADQSEIDDCPKSNVDELPSYVLLSAAYNEESLIEGVIHSVICQTVPPSRWIIISDGCTDCTDEIIQKYSNKYSFIRYMRIDQNEHSGTASKVNALAYAYNALQDIEYDYIGNLDADITFSSEYFKLLIQKFNNDSLLGIAGGTIYEQAGKKFKPRVSNSKNSVAHAVQFARRQCYEDISGYKSLKYGGEDWYAEVTARMFGWTVQSFEDLEVRHHRITGTAGNLKAHRFREGKMDYSIGSNPLFEVLKCMRRIPENPIVLGAILRYCGFISSYIKAEDRLASPNVIRFLRAEQRNRIRQLFGLG